MEPQYLQIKSTFGYLLCDNIILIFLPSSLSVRDQLQKYGRLVLVKALSFSKEYKMTRFQFPAM